MDMKNIAASIELHEKELADAAGRALSDLERASKQIIADMQAALVVARDLGNLSMGELGAKAAVLKTGTLSIQSSFKEPTSYIEIQFPGCNRVILDRYSPLELKKGEYVVVLAVLPKYPEQT